MKERRQRSVPSTPEYKTHPKLRLAPLRLVSPPLSPPPTSPLPDLPVLPEAKLRDPNLKTVHTPRPQTSLPNLRIRRCPRRDAHSCALQCTAHLIQPQSPLRSPFRSPPKSSSDTDLPKSATGTNSKLEQRSNLSRSPIIEDQLIHNPMEAVKTGDQQSALALGVYRSQDWPFRVASPGFTRRHGQSQSPPKLHHGGSGLYVPLPDAVSNRKMCDLSAKPTPSLPQQGTENNVTFSWFSDGDIMQDMIVSPQVATSGIMLCKYATENKAPAMPQRNMDRPSRDFTQQQLLSGPKFQGPGQRKQRMELGTLSSMGRDTLREGQALCDLEMQSEGQDEPLQQTAQPTLMTSATDLESGCDLLPWYIRRRRYMWMLFTIICILLATAGVLAGLLWRLSRI